MNTTGLTKKLAVTAMLMTLWLVPIAATAQTRVNVPKNKYKVQDDIKVGNQAAVEVEKQFPILNDADATRYVTRVGDRLVEAIPQQYQQPAFDYRFKIVNASDINAFALPGGPMYVNRGMIEAARNEGEMAGVMAHEIAHVALRHATAQQTKQGSFGNQLGMLGMIFGGALLGGQTGAQLGMMGAAAWMTKYSRDYETQADVLGANIMANAGYDPRDLANMFRTIAAQGGGGGPEWLSSHPDPGNRFQKINAEARYLNVSPNPIKVTRDFSRIKERFSGMPRARSMSEIAKQSEGQNNPTAGGRYSRNVPYPSTRYRSVSLNNGVSLSVPSNWQQFPSGNDIQFAPAGAYGDQGITHGAMIGVYSGQNSDMAANTQDYVEGLLQANSYLRRNSNFNRINMAGRQGYAATLSGNSPLTNRQEVVNIYTTQLNSGELLYLILISPQDESSSYNNAFRSIINSVRIGY